MNQLTNNGTFTFSDVSIRGQKYRWDFNPVDHQIVDRIVQQYQVAYPVAYVLVQRKIVTDEQIQDFFTSSFEKDVPDPSLLKDANRALSRIVSAIDKGEKILIFGDYDVDGITSSALMMMGLLGIGASVNFYLPNRIRDGYGLSVAVVERAYHNGYTVIVTVDNGITAFDAVNRAKELNIDVIITDHHRPHDRVPDAYAIVNPNQPDCPYPFKYLAGVGVSFKLLSLLYQYYGKELPLKLYELLLLGTVADVVPLVGENRFWVRHTLQLVNNHYSLSFSTLKQNGKVEKLTVNSSDIGFSIAPQLNALGRLEDPRRGVAFLIGQDEKEVHTTGRVLYELNEARKVIEREIFNDIEKMVADGTIDLARDLVIVAGHPGWRAGVIGLVASRIVSTYGRPAIVLHMTDKGIAKGSCRSIPEVSIFDFLAANEDLLEQFGGHSVAAGLSLKIDNIPLLKKRLNALMAERYTAADLVPKMRIDAPISLIDINQKLMRDLLLLEPFGCGNPEPVFLLRSVMMLGEPILLKDQHVKFSVLAQDAVSSVIFFNRPEINTILKQCPNGIWNLLVRVQENHWQGSVSLQLLGIDIAHSEEIT